MVAIIHFTQHILKLKVNIWSCPDMQCIKTDCTYKVNIHLHNCCYITFVKDFVSVFPHLLQTLKITAYVCLCFTYLVCW